MKTRYLAPSDLSYMYDRCKRCYWLKLNGVVGPSDVLPGVFRDIDRAQKAGISIEAIRDLGIPAKEFIAREKVTSLPHEYGGIPLAISGYTDRRVRLDDGTVAVLDFKTSSPRPENRVRFWRALSAYQYAIEHGEQPEEVSMLALVVFSPLAFKLREGDRTQAFYTGRLLRMDIEMDRTKFEKLLHDVGTLLARPTMPDAGACDICRHVDGVVQLRLNEVLDKITADPELGPDLAAKIAARVKIC